MAATTEEFEKALFTLREALVFHEQNKSVETVSKIARDACIQRFEFCIELAWKTAGRVIGSSSTAANLVIRELARNELVDDPELWFTFVKARNLTSHTYKEEVAQAVFDQIKIFLPEAEKILEKLKTR